jgi:type VI secretion system protein ImpJ
MSHKQSIYWHQGLFLQPQHFQMLEQHQDYLRTPLYQTAAPYFWGVSALEISEDALDARMFEVRLARLVLRDRTYVDFPGNAVIQPRSFDNIWLDMDKPLEVYLGIRKLSTVTGNVTEVDSLLNAGGVSTRLVSVNDPEEVPDLYANGPTASIPSVVQVVRVFFGQELASLDDYELIQVAQLSRDNAAIRLVPRYIPPCYAMQGDARLVDILKDIRDDMVGRLRQLQEYKVPREAQRMDLDPDYLVLLQAVQSLNRYVPAVLHLAETPTVHPWQVYGLLRSIIGELSSFSDRYDFLGKRDNRDEGVLSYDHEKLGDCFLSARQLINALLNEITIGPAFLVVLEPQGLYRVGKIPAEYFTRRNRFYLVTHTNMPVAKGVDSFTKVARLASLDALATIIDHALPGADLIEIANPPQGLPRRPDSRYYRIEQMSDAWDAVEQTGHIGLFWPDAPSDLRAEIVVLRG